ncbi:MAG: hypothetical protein ACT4P7_18660 [Gemmatimonadaceae bacterium]
MTRDRVSEAAPVQVYLDRNSRDRLARLAANLDTSKSDILRRGLIALERELTDPDAHPALRLVGAASGEPVALEYDIAREHDRFLAQVTERSPAPYKKSRRKKPRG